MNIADKHRLLGICLAIPHDEFDWELIKNENVSLIAYVVTSDFHLDFTKPVIDAVMMQWGGVPIDANREVRMDCDLTFEIVFGDGVAFCQPIIPHLHRLCDFVATGVIDPLCEFL